MPDMDYYLIFIFIYLAVFLFSYSFLKPLFKK